MRVRTSGTGHAIVDKILAREEIERSVVVNLPSFLGVASIVAQTELLALVPERYASVVAASEAVRFLPIPVELPSYQVKQHWHERYHADRRTAGCARWSPRCSPAASLIFCPGPSGSGTGRIRR